MKGVFINDYIKDKETRVMEKSITLYFIMKGLIMMRKASVVFQIMDGNYINIKNIYACIDFETMQFENSMFSKVELIGSKLYECRYDIEIYGVKLIKNSNIPITKELEDLICYVVNNSKFIKENNIKSYELIICASDNRVIIEIDNYIKDNYRELKVLSHGILSIKYVSNKEFIIGDD